MSAKKQQDDDRRRCGMAAVGVPVGVLTRPIFGKHGFAGGALIVDWPAVVGGAAATYTLPLRIRFPRNERTGGTLEIKVANSAFAAELQHLEPLIIERINGYFGWAAVARLKLRHGPLPVKKPVKPTEPQMSGDQEQRLHELTAQVDHPELRAVLERLGRHLASKP